MQQKQIESDDALSLIYLQFKENNKVPFYINVNTTMTDLHRHILSKSALFREFKQHIRVGLQKTDPESGQVRVLELGELVNELPLEKGGVLQVMGVQAGDVLLVDTDSSERKDHQYHHKLNMRHSSNRTHNNSNRRDRHYGGVNKRRPY